MQTKVVFNSVLLILTNLDPIAQLFTQIDVEIMNIHVCNFQMIQDVNLSQSKWFNFMNFPKLAYKINIHHFMQLNKLQCYISVLEGMQSLLLLVLRHI